MTSGEDKPNDVDSFADAFADALDESLRTEPVDVDATTIEGPSPHSSTSEVRTVPAEGSDGLTEEILSSVRSWQGVYLAVDDVTARLPNGKLAHRDVVRHPGAVAIIALTDDSKLVMVHQYRTSLEQVTLEIPAGKLMPGEDPVEAARRELEEETGYAAAQMAYLAPIAPAAGYSDELLHLYMAMGLEFVGAHPDADEFVNVDVVDLAELVDRVLDGDIVDSKTVIGVLLCDAILSRMPRQ